MWSCEIRAHTDLVGGYFSDSQHLLWEKWIFKGELNEQQEAHVHKDHVWKGKEPLEMKAASAVSSSLKD